jgi:hypothetical protein
MQQQRNKPNLPTITITAGINGPRTRQPAEDGDRENQQGREERNDKGRLLIYRGMQGAYAMQLTEKMAMHRRLRLLQCEI